jgi:murein DD-endopeptidase MepM/ murein hydrolase activator NlpD
MGWEMSERLGLLELFGLKPFGKRLGEVRLMLRGDAHTPPSRFDHTSLRIFSASLALRTWAGLPRRDRRAPIYNLFNHTQTPVEEGWSVRVTQVRDFRGKTRTYDSHNGTDLAVPPGTTTVAGAPGRVLRISDEFHRGGLKIFVDHGQGVVTTSNHMGRALVEVGQDVARAEPIGLSGASGVDMVGAFPWNCPHVHFNVWLNGEHVDPFALEGEPSLWRRHNDPVPHSGPRDEEWEPTTWDEAGVEAGIEACEDPALRGRLEAVEPLERRAMDVLFHRNYFPTRFSARPAVYDRQWPRAPLLDLPFRADEIVGIVHLDA